jgi:hypothetical protein
LTTDALIDTEAEISLFDERLAGELGINLGGAIGVRLYGVGGEVRIARLAEVELRLLGQAELTFSGEVAFAPGTEAAHGNLLALDILDHFDFALSHTNRVGYLGPASEP